MPFCVTLDTTGVGNNTARNRKLKRSCRAPDGDSSTREKFARLPPEKKFCGEVHRICTDRSHTRITLRVSKLCCCDVRESDKICDLC